MTDIVERLRKEIGGYTDKYLEEAEANMREAANEIERLRDELRKWNEADSAAVRAVMADNDRLREALDNIEILLSQAKIEDCENGVKWLNEQAAQNYLHDYRNTRLAIEESLDHARAALEGKQ